jgi:hypothetical protein
LLLFNPTDNIAAAFRIRPWLATIVMILFIIIFLFSLAAALNKKPSIVISETGIQLLGEDYFAWDEIRSFHTIFYTNYETDPDYIVFVFKESKKLEYCISNLCKTRGAIVSLILDCQPAICYTGHIDYTPEPLF